MQEYVLAQNSLALHRVLKRNCFLLCSTKIHESTKKKRKKKQQQKNLSFLPLFLYHHGHYPVSHKLISFSLQFILGLLSPSVFFSSASWLVPQLNQKMNDEKAFPSSALSSAPNHVYFAACVFLYPKD